MFGRHMNYKLGYLHFWLTLISFNATFFLMHVVGLGGMQRRVADPYAKYAFIDSMLPMNKFMTISAIVLGATQLIFMANFLWSIWKGAKADQNPWKCNTLEWTAAPTPTIHGNFPGRVPNVYRGPYEYASPDVDEDWLPQDKDLGARETAASSRH
jgi:cytochrome c oxidase subunit 1